jgi:hypothetical protein
MTPFKNYGKNPSGWKNRIRRGGLYVAVAAMIGGLPACSSDNGGDWEQVTTYQVTKGVVTVIEETEDGKFSIVDEQVVEGKDASRVVIKRLNGAVDTLTLDQARGMVQASDTTTTQNHSTYRNHSSGLGHVIWWGAMGYMMGRSFGSPVQSGIYRGGTTGGTAFRSGSFAAGELQRTAVARTEMRPVKSRSGFFKSSRSGSSGRSVGS